MEPFYEMRKLVNTEFDVWRMKSTSPFEDLKQIISKIQKEGYVFNNSASARLGFPIYSKGNGTSKRYACSAMSNVYDKTYVLIYAICGIKNFSEISKIKNEFKHEFDAK